MGENTHSIKQHEHADETTAMLSYMVKHNIHHEEELKELSASLSGDALAMLNEALNDFHAGNEKLQKLLELVGNK